MKFLQTENKENLGDVGNNVKCWLDTEKLIILIYQEKLTKK